MATTTLQLYLDQSDRGLELLSFPLIVIQTSTGSKELQQQMRIDNVGETSGEKGETIFINLYGFIKSQGVKESSMEFLSVNSVQQKDTITAGMVVLGATRMSSDYSAIAADALSLSITIKKSALAQEKIAVSIHNSPYSLSGALAVRSGGFIASAEETIKCSSKIQAGVYYTFKPMFVSITRLNNGKLYRVPKAMHTINSDIFFKVQLEVEFKLGIKSDHPQAKMLKKVEIDGKPEYFGYCWFHLCNFKKTNAKGESRSLEAIKDKVRKMGLKISIHDLWGPTIIVQITGKSSKYAQGFFSTKGTSCLPVSKSNPELAKLMWSCDTKIHSALVIVQAGDKSRLLKSEDIEVSGAVVASSSGLPKYNPFKKVQVKGGK
uniref:Matrix protein n=1 Tax=avian paramyxovirus 20 TaxID=2560314 RepID=A0A4Y5T9Z0_9MONO|nr:matrix protein [Avian metaavulavirus 20]